MNCKTIIATGFLLAAIGCRAEPFVRAPLPLLNHPNPQLIREHSAESIPPLFTSDDTVILQAPFHDDFAVLGVLNVDRKAGTFELFGLNQMGVQFFHIGGDRNDVAIRDAIPPLMEHKDILLAMAHDIQRIYFELSPSSDSQVRILPSQVNFRKETDDGKLTYEFGYDPSMLLEKRLDGFFGTKWRVQYYDYLPGAGGKLYPHGIVMDNYHFHYRIIIKNRDWSVEE